MTIKELERKLWNLMKDDKTHGDKTVQLVMPNGEMYGVDLTLGIECAYIIPTKTGQMQP